jgi:hypothetical protein
MLRLRRFRRLDNVAHKVLQSARRTQLVAVMVVASCAAHCVHSAALLAQAPGTWVVTPTVQQNGTSVRMPVNRPVSRKSKLQLTVDTRWANNFGYRPIFVTVSSPTPTTANHLITIRLHIAGWGWYQGQLSIEQDFEMPLGQTSFTTSVPCPHYRLDTQFCWWEVWVDGAKDRDLSMEENTARSTMAAAFNPGAQAGLSCLVVGPGGPQRTLMTPSTMQFDVLSIAIGDMPERWIEYSCFDVVALSLSELRFLSQSKPQAYQALRRWLRTGGQLWVSDVGDKFDELAEVSKLLQLRPAVSELAADDVGEGITVVETDEDSPIVSWRPVRFETENQGDLIVTFQNLMNGRQIQVRDPQTIARLQRDPNFAVTSQESVTRDALRRRRGPGESSRWFLEQPMGLGVVHAVRGENDIALFAQGKKIALTNGGTPENGAMLMDSATGVVSTADGATTDGSERMPPALALGLRSARTWESRHGMTPNSANRDFINLLVPGVGLAPVTEFRVLITLFVLLIGPGNYWFLKRFRRSHLLVLTVPTAALVTTAALFGYAILSDGFGTTARVHSYTTLDQRTGEAACWARLSFYSGLAPGQGLTVPSDVTIYPIIPGWNEGSADPDLGAQRDLMWESDEAKLTRGWLRSRTPTQYLTIRARKSPHFLELLPADGKIRATNKLGSPIKFVAAADENGDLFGGSNLQIDQRVMLQPVERIAAIRDFRREYLANQPEVPPELLAPGSEFALFEDRSQRRMYRQFGVNYSEDTLSKNLAGEAVSKLAGLTTEPALNLTPRSYVAITETGPEVVIGMSGVNEQKSFHVVVGQW